MKHNGIKCIEIKGCNTRNIAGFVKRRREEEGTILKRSCIHKEEYHN